MVPSFWIHCPETGFVGFFFEIVRLIPPCSISFLLLLTPCNSFSQDEYPRPFSFLDPQIFFGLKAPINPIFRKFRLLSWLCDWKPFFFFFGEDMRGPLHHGFRISPVPLTATPHVFRDSVSSHCSTVLQQSCPLIPLCFPEAMPIFLRLPHPSETSRCRTTYPTWFPFLVTPTFFLGLNTNCSIFLSFQTWDSQSWDGCSVGHQNHLHPSEHFRWNPTISYQTPPWKRLSSPMLTISFFPPWLQRSTSSLKRVRCFIFLWRLLLLFPFQFRLCSDLLPCIPPVLPLFPPFSSLLTKIARVPFSQLEGFPQNRTITPPVFVIIVFASFAW